MGEAAAGEMAGPWEELERHYLHGRYLDAYSLARQQLGPLPEWRGTEGRLLAGKLARMLGNRRLGSALIYLAWREERGSARAFGYYARNYFARHGLWQTLRLIERYAHFFEAQAVTPDLLAFRAYLHGYYRDFTRADALIGQALDAAADNPWLHVEHAYLLEMEDEYEAAIASTERALALVPCYRPAVQQKVHLLQLCGRGEEAHALLHEARGRLQSEGIEAQLLVACQEREARDEVAATLERIEALVPLKSKEYEQWLAGQRCNLHYLRGDTAAAIAEAERNGGHYFTRIAETLREHGAAGRRRRIQVEFVRQRHMTCGPATLSALSAFFGRPVAQQAIIDSIWYAGTQDYDERKWAQENGWHVAELSLDWESARALIDAGIPCAVATVEADSAHLQALTGYDERLGVLFIRDPFSQFEQEYLQQPFFEKYRPFGPRAMVLVPQQQAALLDGLNLPEREGREAFFRIRDALKQHRRDAAQQLFEEAFGGDPEATLACQARRELGWYDNNMEEVAAVDRLLFARFPENHRIKLNQLYSLNRLGRRDLYLGMLREEGERAEAHLSLLSLYAEVLGEDGREQHRSERLLQQILDRAPKLATAYQSYGYLTWQQRRLAESERLYQIAASLDEADEGFALDYYRLARLNKHGEEVLAWLRQRFERNAAKSAYPAITLYRAYEIMNHEHLGIEVLQQALQQRPGDGELLLFASDAQLDNGNWEEAERLLTQAREHTNPGRWLFTAARHAASRHQHQRALELFSTVVENEPLNHRAHEQIVRLLGDLQGEARAIEHVRGMCGRFPHNLRFHEQLISLLQEGQPREAEAELRTLLQRHPDHAYGHRQLADLLLQADRYDEAWSSLERAGELEPDAVGLHNIRGDLFARRGERDRAMASYRESLRLSADNEYAISALMRLCHTSAERREQLDYLLGQLMAQTTSGAGLLSYQQAAHNILPAEQLLATLREAHRLRPDLWQSWSTLIGELRERGELGEAEALAEGAVERFPLLPRCYLDLADVYKRRQELERQQQALEAALRINPHWDVALMELADNYELRGDYQGELRMLQAAAAAEPSSARLQGYLADALWRQGEADGALAAIRTALELSPGYDWAWGRLRAWAKHLGREGLVEETARAVTQQKPGSPHSWYYLAAALWQLDEVLAALDRAIACNPNYLAAYEEKVETLVRHNRFSEARQVIAAYDRGHGIPVALRRYGPWMDYRLGEVEKAVVALKALLEEEPAYYTGWSMLANWCENNERPGDFLLACRRMVVLQPENSGAWVQLGDALLVNGERGEAKQAFHQAMAITPGHDYAGLTLFDLQLEDGELQAAAETLAHQQLHLPPENQGYITTRALQLACRQGDQGEALRQFHLLTREPRENSWYFDTTLSAFAEAGWEAALEAAFDEVVQDLSGINPALATLWARRQHEGREREWRLSDQSITRLLQMGRAGHRVVEEYLSYLHRIGTIVRLDRLIKRHRRELREDIDSLANVAYIYAAQGRYRENVAWMAGWREMKGLPAWALNNLAISLRETGDWGRHYEVLQRLMPVITTDIASGVRMWMALESALRGQWQTVEDLFDLIDAESLSGDNYFAYQLLLAMVECDQETGQSAAERLPRVLQTLREGLHGYHGLVNNMMLWRLQHRVLWHLAQRMAPMPGALYYWWRMMDWSKFFF